MVLAGGPDRERVVSLQSGRQIAHALHTAGYTVTTRDALPDNLAALDQAANTPDTILFPVLHGPWGEGGPLQQHLQQRGLRFVGSDATAAALCMDKHATKQTLKDAGLPTPDFQHLQPDDTLRLNPPLVLKPLAEGSSLGMAICHTPDDTHAARKPLHDRFGTLLAEAFIPGRELTVGILETPQSTRALPIIEIRSATDFYDYDAKYERNDTAYLFDLNLPQSTLSRITELALATHRITGARHLSRVDLMLEHDTAEPQILEINTTPGFTTHSLFPMAARHAGIPDARLVAGLVELAASQPAPASI
ncbi:D-alanine--D-alanine ligase Ddl [Mucisphaera calidilacus]|uniref:D-alanine--D-alanine ligase n=2 Tax=Mucisphaera calidilacus TaxID=2527982 RepID=A0A518C161_9BACT|nr:D-alanine--D-alanine ligase Ddl [Mucisphaera calidilacus]